MKVEIQISKLFRVVRIYVGCPTDPIASRFIRTDPKGKFPPAAIKRAIKELFEQISQPKQFRDSEFFGTGLPAQMHYLTSGGWRLNIMDDYGNLISVPYTKNAGRVDLGTA